MSISSLAAVRPRFRRPTLPVARVRRGLAPVIARLGPAVDLVRPAGWAVLLLSVLCLVIGRRTGWEELTVVAAAGLVTVVAAVPFVLGRTSVDVQLRLTPQRLSAGEPPVTGSVVVENIARRPLMPVELELPVGVRSHRFRLPVLGSGSRHEESFLVPAERRAVIAVGPARTRRGDPLGLFSRNLTWTDTTEIFVRPRTLPLDTLGSGLLRDLEGVSTNEISMSDLAFHALREYVPGDDLRHVHWLASAKSGQLMVRQYLDTRRSHVTIVVDADPASYSHPDDFEMALSVAATIARRSFLDEFDVSFVCGVHASYGGGSTRVLDTMCRAEQATERDLVHVTIDASRIARDTSLLFVVSGTTMSYPDVQRACVAFGPEVRRYAIRVSPDAPPTVSDGDGLPVLTVGRLENVPAVLRWSVR